MQFVINGQVLTIDDLDPPIDKAFLQLHAAYLSNRPCNWADFQEAALEFFNGTGNTAEWQDRFFSNFTIIWQRLLNSGQRDAAEAIWEMALRPAFQWESQHPESFIHKGTPFYFWGMTCILRGDLDRGYALMHRSVQEDCRTQNTQFPATPGFALATLDYAKVDQAFREWVVMQAQELQAIIDLYNKSYTRNLSLDDLRHRFLSTAPNRDTVFLLIYTLARLIHLQRVPDYALHSDFAGQLEMNLLFDITLVIDAAIKAKNPNEWEFMKHALFLADSAGLGLDSDKLGEVNAACRKDFDQALAAILDGSFHFKDGTGLCGPATDLAIAYGVRNRGAHNVSAVSTVWKRFPEIKQKLFNALFLVVETLY